MARLHVDLGPASYDIVIGEGVLGQAGRLIKPHLNRNRTVIVTDETVAGHYLGHVNAALGAEEIHADAIVLPPGEATKSFAHLEEVCGRLIALGVERGDTILALGGGVIGDLAGFAAATLHRGIAFIQIPTTLLAQVDSSVGGKTGINLGQGKNLVGAFHQPKLVLADIRTLASLSGRDYLSGYAEVVKYGALGDAAFFDWLTARDQAVKARDPAFLIEAVRRSCLAKAAIVAEDEKERGRRALLNLGHTFGHAFEACAGYDGRVLHGEAVAVGMGLAFDLSARLGHADTRAAEALRAHLRAVGLPAEPGDLGVDFDLDDVMAAMARDKKTVDGALTFILASGIGAAFIARGVAPEPVKELLTGKGVGPRAGEPQR